MEQIVKTGLKLDLHIHSKASSAKDGAKVNNNTLENIPLLIDKLSKNNVNICAITDHDSFSYDMYSGLKSAEEQDNPIRKVLPGVEFSVCFSEGQNESVIHVVTIFSDEDDNKIKDIETILGQNRPQYKSTYKEEEFLALLRKIDINTILIAHQKNTLTSQKLRKNDANTLGNNKFLEFVYTDYFEAFEFKNRRNEVLNKSFLVQNGLEEQLRFVTGTDCHDWSVYPSETPSEIIDTFPYTYAKCLPTFKGLVMAITDHTRLNWVNSFFNVDKNSLEKITLCHREREITIPLSKGINVIIGDNSIGKSLLLHAITGYEKKGAALPSKIKTGYKKYLSKINLDIKPQIKSENIFNFDMQGEVRSKFEENKLNATDFLKSYFPPPVNASLYRNIIDAEIGRMISYLEKKFALDAKIEELSTFEIVISEDNAESMTFINNIRGAKKKPDSMIAISTQIKNIVLQLQQLLGLEIDESDEKYIKQTVDAFTKMEKRYSQRANVIDNENSRMESVAKIVKKYADQHRRSISDTQKKRSAFTENTSELRNQLTNIIKLTKEIKPFTISSNVIKVKPNSEIIYDYEFISKLNVDAVGSEYINSLISKVLKAGKKIDWISITEKQLQEMLLRYDETPVLQFLKMALNSIMDEDFAPKNSIIYQGTDQYAEMSSGLDAKIYFDLLSYETHRDGIYIIDQPEDNISQSAIRDYLLERFKNMGENRQILMVSHNPQFIVNLDVDNLIFLSKAGDALEVQSGALEYVCSEYNVLEIVAQNIDGGLDSIRKRWKRYEKTPVI